MLLNSVSGDGLSTRATVVARWVVSAVSEDTPVRVDACELDPDVGPALGIELVLACGRVGTMYSSGMGTQWLEN
jgi:hypothetical protein